MGWPQRDNASTLTLSGAFKVEASFLAVAFASARSRRCALSEIFVRKTGSGLAPPSMA
jgi:hypothetical protein